MKGKERADGIKELENINAYTREEAEVVQAQAKKKALDTGSKRKSSDVFSAQDDPRGSNGRRLLENLRHGSQRNGFPLSALTSSNVRSIADPRLIRQP